MFDYKLEVVEVDGGFHVTLDVTSAPINTTDETKRSLYAETFSYHDYETNMTVQFSPWIRGIDLATKYVQIGTRDVYSNKPPRRYMSKSGATRYANKVRKILTKPEFLERLGEKYPQYAKKYISTFWDS